MYAPNFLAYFNPRAPWGCSMVLLVLALGLGYAALLMLMPSLAVVLAVAGIVAVCAFKPLVGLSLMALTNFFQGLILDFSAYPWAREVPGLATVNAPLVDFLAMLAAAGLIVAWLLRLPAWNKGKWQLPGWQWYGAFLILAGISAQLVYSHDVGTAWYSWLRPMFFVYAMYVVLVGRLVTTPAAWLRVAKIWFGVGVAIATYGLVSLLVVAPQGWVRATPFPLFGLTPLGINHNGLAEPLVAIIPIAAWLAWYYRRHALSQWLRWGTGLMVVVCLLTLSRSAWLSLLLEAGIFAWLYRYDVRKRLQQLPSEFKIIAVAVVIGALGYMAFFLTSHVVASSSVARWEVSEITLAYVSARPVLGFGPGTFVELLANSYVYTLEYGEALDAHGFVQKLLVETGVLGLIAFVGFLVWTVRTVIGRVRDDVFYQALLCLVAGIIMYQLFSTSYWNAVFWLPLGLALAGTALTKQK